MSDGISRPSVPESDGGARMASASAQASLTAGAAMPIANGTDAQRAEARLVERAKSDPEAFGRLYEAHYGAILSYLYRRTLDAATAEDLASGTFFKALRALPRYKPRASFRAWLYRIATNELRMHWRRLGTRGRHVEWNDADLPRLRFGPSPLPDPAEAAQKAREYVRLHRALDALPERYRTALVLRYIEDLSVAEVAEALGKRLGTVKSLIHRGLRRLRTVLADDDATFADPAH